MLVREEGGRLGGESDGEESTGLRIDLVRGEKELLDDDTASADEIGISPNLRVGKGRRRGNERTDTTGTVMYDRKNVLRPSVDPNRSYPRR